MIRFIVVSVGLFMVGCASNPQKEEINSAAGLTNIRIVSDSSAEAPYLFTDDKNHVFLSWTQKQSSANALMLSRLNGSTWTEPQVVAEGSNWFVNWADYPVIATKNGNFIAHYLEKSSKDTYSYDIKITQSTDGGTVWQQPFVLHDDGKQAEHGFLTALPYKENFFVTWLDGRYTTGHGHEADGGAMTLRAAIIGPQGQKIEEWELDDRVCDCCQTTAVITEAGPVVAYRDRSEKEVRDISVIKFADNTWSEPKAVYQDDWEIKGCPVNGPRMSAEGDHVVIGWFTAAENEPKVQISFSKDGGLTFTKPAKVDLGEPIGRIDIEILDEGNAFITWMEGGKILAAKVTVDGKISKRYTLAESNSSRSSGFPQITKREGKIIVAWTDAVAGVIKTGVLAL